MQVLLPLSKVCALVVEGELWRCAGSSLHDFTREQLERTGSGCAGMPDLHDAIQRLPGLRVAVTGGDGGAPIGLCKGMLVGRVATESTLRGVGRACATVERGSVEGDGARGSGDCW
ncbi:MAG: hypothetical protein U0V87_02425 [Acidobacteriota bacterium]